jgi:hypothetical protein
MLDMIHYRVMTGRRFNDSTPEIRPLPQGAGRAAGTGKTQNNAI